MPIQPVLRRKTNEVWTDKHRHATRKLVVEGGWVQTRLYDTGWWDEKKCRGCNRREGTEKHKLFHCPSWREIRNQIPKGLATWRATDQHVEGGLEVAAWNHGALL